jgi:hypothetical protein
MKLFGHISLECLKELVHAAGIHALAIAIERSLHVDMLPALISAALLRTAGMKLLVWLSALLRRVVAAIAAPVTRALFVPALRTLPVVGLTFASRNKPSSSNYSTSLPVRKAVVIRRRAFLKAARKQRQNVNRR